MQHADTTAAGETAARISEPVAGVIAGVIAGAAYLLAQVSFAAALRPGGAAEPLQRIAAMLMGPDIAPPPAEITFTVFGMAMIIHFALSMTFGRIVSVLSWRRRTGTGILVGALVGLALFALDFGLIAPAAFPWFEDSLRWPTMVDHALFGAVAAAVCLALRGRRPVESALQR
jgi:hypothetical protein